MQKCTSFSPRFRRSRPDAIPMSGNCAHADGDEHVSSGSAIHLGRPLSVMRIVFGESARRAEYCKSSRLRDSGFKEYDASRTFCSSQIIRNLHSIREKYKEKQVKQVGHSCVSPKPALGCLIVQLLFSSSVSLSAPVRRARPHLQYGVIRHWSGVRQSCTSHPNP
jgi:hypothetical protein